MVCITSRNVLTIFPDITRAAAIDNAAIIPHSVYIMVNNVELRVARSVTLASVNAISVLRKVVSWERSRSISVLPGSVWKNATTLA
ncbi:hypothetical protein D3C74_412360 [compost metagenome]